MELHGSPVVQPLAGVPAPRYPSEDVLDAAFRTFADPFIIMTAVREGSEIVDLEFSWLNGPAAEYLGNAHETLLGTRLLQWLPAHGPSGLFARYARVIETGEPLVEQDFHYALETADQVRIFDLRGVQFGDAIALTFRDVTDRHAQTEALRHSEGLLCAVIAKATIGVAVVSLDGMARMVNGALQQMLLRDADWLTSRPLISVIHPEDRHVARIDRQQLVEGEGDTLVRQFRLVRSDGTTVWVRRTAALMRNQHGEPDYLLVQVEDRSGEHEAKERLQYERYHDELTGLHNLAWIQDTLQTELSACPHDRQIGVLFIDLDNFKVVNDSLGHGAGDRVLTTVAQRINGQLPDHAHLGRFGGDEFVVIVPDVAAAKQLETIAERTLDAVAKPVLVQGHTVVPSACIGIGLSTQGSTPAELLRDTDSALFKAKAAGRGAWQFFDEDTHTDAVERLTIESQLRDSLGCDRFVVHYQPIVHLLEERIVGFEALVRWDHPTRGLLSPAQFLPIAEDSGLVVDISQEVAATVCRTLAAYPQIPSISLNLSAVELLQSGWSASLLNHAREAGIDPRRLTVEITETAALDISARTRTGLRTLRKAGVNVHVDDFGTGFSSIALLRELPVTGLKLDASFVHDLTSRKSAANALAAGLAGLADGLGLTGIAEGIEREDQARRLVTLGWRYGQGFHFGRPQPIPAISSDLERSTT